MSQLKYRRIDRRKPESTYLLKSHRNVTSQGGEDGIIERILQLIGTDPAGSWCAEFGAWDGKHLSNTYNLINNHSYKGVMIEGSAERFQDLLKTYGDNQNTYCINRMVTFQPGPDSLDSIFSTTPIPKAFDLLSIDIDGNDWYVWESLNNYQPRIVVIELNCTIPNDVYFVQSKDFRVNQGCSLLALIELGKTKGYELAAVTLPNAIFVRIEDFPKLNIVDNSIDAMHLPLYEGKIFQGFDGTLFNVGLERLQWRLKKLTVNPLQFQLLPDHDRWFISRDQNMSAGPPNVDPIKISQPIDISKEEAFFSLAGRHQRLVDSLANVRAASGTAYTPPPTQVPAEFLDEFTMQGRAKIVDWYLNSKPDPKSLSSLVMYRKPVIAQARKDIAQRKYKSYGVTNDYLRAALTHYSIKSKFVLIIGSVYPQYECFCLNAGARPVTIEYNVRFSDSDALTFFSPAQFDALGVKGEAAIAISSYEHDGLGRYGDPVDPNGDLKSMRKLQAQLEPGSLAFISVPVGRDAVVWNAHRIYGPHRLPMLFEQWEVLSCFGDDHQLVEVRSGKLVVHHEKWDSHFAPSRSGPEWVFVLRTQ